MDVLSYPPSISPLPCISIAIALVLLQFRTFFLLTVLRSLATIGSLNPPHSFPLLSSSSPLDVFFKLFFGSIVFLVILFLFYSSSTLVTNYPKVVPVAFHLIDCLIWYRDCSLAFFCFPFSFLSPSPSLSLSKRPISNCAIFSPQSPVSV